MAGVDVTPNKDGGVLKEILTEGTGHETAPSGSTVKAHYHGTLTDGTIFDSSVQRNVPFDFALGKGQVIKAWDIGVATMRKGEVARFTCRADYAYGESGSPPKIPGGATLIFDITLLSWEEEDLTADKDGGIYRAILVKGEGFASPADFCVCKVNLKGSHDGRVFDERELTLTLGEGSEVGIPRGVELALQKMNKGEKSRLTIGPQYGWPTGNTQFSIPAGATIKYEVHLLEFEKEKESWDMDSAEKLAEASLLKSRATDRFQAGKFALASKLYAKAASYIDSEQGFSEAEEVERKKILLAIRLNLGLVHLKLGQSYEARTECDKALQIDPSNVKGLFRRGQAYLLIAEPEIAKADFEQVVKLEPSNNAAIAQINVCKQKIKEIKAKEKQIYTNMFDKFARKDTEENYHYGWWNDRQKQPVITEIEPEQTEDLEEKKREKKKQLEHLKRVAEQKRKEREEAELKAKEGNLPQVERQLQDEQGETQTAKENTEDNVSEVEKDVANEETKTHESSVRPSHDKAQEAGYFFGKERTEREKLPDTMSVLGEWGKEAREDREMTNFEKENPDVLLLNKDDLFQNM